MSFSSTVIAIRMRTYMGIANDGVSSINGGPLYNPTCSGGTHATYTVALYSDNGYSGSSFQVLSGSSNSLLTSFNDVTSSISTLFVCIG